MIQNISTGKNQFIRIKKIDINTILDTIISFTEEKNIVQFINQYNIKKDKNWPFDHYIDDFKYDIRSRRLRLFKFKGISCIKCKKKASYFALEKLIKTERDYSLNLYINDEELGEILMTIDHKIPKSLGGNSSFSNLQPMCFICNQQKGNNYL